MKKLVCDRCGKELTEKEDIEIALEGKEAWEATVRAGGAEPRGVLPCENFIRCGGEIKLVGNSRLVQWRRWLMKLLSQ